jgi:hypothetical protein
MGELSSRGFLSVETGKLCPFYKGYSTGARVCSVARLARFWQVGEQNRVAADTFRPLRHFGIVLAQPGAAHLRFVEGCTPTSAISAMLAARSR